MRSHRAGAVILLLALGLLAGCLQEETLSGEPVPGTAVAGEAPREPPVPGGTSPAQVTPAQQVPGTPSPAPMEVIPASLPVSGEREHVFLFNGSQYSVRTGIREGYAGRSWQMLNTFPGDTADETTLPAYYRFRVMNTSQELLYEDILADLRAIRQREGLDDAAYVELIIAYVQSFRYNSPSGYTRLPIDVIEDDQGDCDERACLLAGLLRTEGYDVALLGIDLANGRTDHMGVGIRSNGFRFSSTDYTFIETTAPYPIGYSPYDTRAMKLPGLTQYYFTRTGVAIDDMAGQPIVIPLGGNRRYGNGVKAQEIYNAALRLSSTNQECHEELPNLEKTISFWEDMAEACEGKFDCHMFDPYRYEIAIKDYNAMVDRHNTVTELYNYLLDGPTDSIDTIHARIGIWAYSNPYEGA